MNKRVGIRGEHAHVRVLSPIEQANKFGLVPKKSKANQSLFGIAKESITTRMRIGVLVKRTHLSKNTNVPSSYSTAMSLANLLFPSSFPRLVATGLKTKGQSHSSITYSELVPLTSKSKASTKSFYDYLRNHSFRGKHFQLAEKNQKQIFAEVKRLEESGLVINYFFPNVGIKRNGAGKSFVFFEVGAVDLKKLHRFIRKLPQKTPNEKLRKAQAWNLFEFLKQQPVEKDGLVLTHAKEKN